MIRTMKQQDITPHVNLQLAPEVERTERRTISIEPSLWAIARSIGRGNASAGVRWLLQQAREGQNTGSREPTSET